MTYLEVAKELLANISNSRTPQDHIAMAQAQATIALVEEQQKTNALLATQVTTHTAILNLATSVVARHYNVDVLDAFTEHARPCGDDEEQAIVGLG